MLLCTTARKHDLFSIPEIIILMVSMGIREEKGTYPLNEVSQIAYDTPMPQPWQAPSLLPSPENYSQGGCPLCQKLAFALVGGLGEGRRIFRGFRLRTETGHKGFPYYVNHWGTLEGLGGLFLALGRNCALSAMAKLTPISGSQITGPIPCDIFCRFSSLPCLQAGPQHWLQSISATKKDLDHH